jgi:hypothetical protein
VLLVASTALFAVGVIAERSDTDTHVESAATTTEGGEAEGAHARPASRAPPRRKATRSPRPARRTPRTNGSSASTLESTPLVVLALLAGLGLAVLAASRVGRLPGFLVAVVVIALVWAALDVREVVHQLDESRTGVAVVAITVTLLHLAVAAGSGKLARERTAAP